MDGKPRQICLNGKREKESLFLCEWKIEANLFRDTSLRFPAGCSQATRNLDSSICIFIMKWNKNQEK